MTQSSEYAAQPGDLVGFYTKGAFAFLIRLGQRLAKVQHRGVTHIAVITSVTTEEVRIVQSVRRVNEVTLASYGATPQVVVPFPGFAANRADVIDFAKSCIGRKYGVLSVISRGLNCLTPHFVNFNRAGDMDCSALGARALEHGGVILSGTDPWQYTPGQLVDEFLKETA